MREFTIVINECAQPALPNVAHVRTRDTQNGTQNFNARFDHLAEGLPTTLSPRQLDWLDIAVGLYAIDLACDRGEGDTDWARDIRAFIPVRDPDFWSPFATDFQELFMDLTLDRLRIDFRGEEQPQGPPRTGRRFVETDCVALLSGGVDSYVGALMLLESRRKPLFLSHASGGITRYQRHVERRLKHVDADRDFVGFGVEAVRTGSVFPGNEGSQRSRTLLFMAVAALAAAAEGVEQVFLNENGIMAVHVPVSPARIGSLSTKTAIPALLNRLSRLSTRTLESRVSVSNELISLTKPQVVAKACELGGDDGLQGTASCWTVGRTASHCGFCAPCVMRRISFLTHGVSDVTYDSDVLTDPRALDRADAKDTLTQICQFVHELTTLSDAELFIEYGELLDGGPDLTPEETLQLYRRWGAEAMSVLSSSPVPQALLP